VQATTPWSKPDSRFTALLEAVVIDRPNEAAESMHARIQRIERMACGYRNRERFRNAILLHLGGLDLYSRPISTHTTS
jgi:transposase